MPILRGLREGYHLHVAPDRHGTHEKDVNDLVETLRR